MVLALVVVTVVAADAEPHLKAPVLVLVSMHACLTPTHIVLLLHPHMCSLRCDIRGERLGWNELDVPHVEVGGDGLHPPARHGVRRGRIFPACNQWRGCEQLLIQLRALVAPVRMEPV